MNNVLRFIFLVISFTLFSAVPLSAQTQKEISLDVENEALAKVFKRIEKQCDYKIMYATDDVKGLMFTGKVRAKTIHDAMKQVLAGKHLIFVVDRQFVTVKQSRFQDAQNQQVSSYEDEGEAYTISGKVVDENGVSMPGVTIFITGTKMGTSTDINGRYTLKVKKGDVLRYSFVGYKEQIAAVKGKKNINIDMQPDEQTLKEVQVVAFGSQKKESVVSSITTVKPGDLKVSSSDLTTSFAGRIPGMVAWQTGGLPGALTESEMNTKFYIRGITSFQSGANTDPLVLIDGVESSKLELSRLQVEDIESFSVLKDASATAMYGARGANGVIMVTTKKGEEGSVYTTFRYESILTQPTENIDVVDPVTYMKMYNQALLSRYPSASPVYTVERIQRTESGKYPSWLYPKNDWFNQLFKDFSWNHHGGVNIRGGSSRVQYYAAVNFNHDEGMLKTDKLNEFDCNITNNTTQFRTNLNIDLKAGIKLVINSVATLDKYHGPIQDQREAYLYAFNASPVDFAPLYPADATYNWPHLRFGTTPSGKINPYAELQKGYVDRTRFQATNQAEYIHNLSALLKGLELRLRASLSHTNYYTNAFSTVPYKYSLVNYDFETGTHKLQPQNSAFARRTLESEGSNSTSETRTAYTATLLHTAAWGGDENMLHQTSLTGVAQMQERTFSPINYVLNGQPQRNLTFSMRGTYGLLDRYFAEASFGYNGSERFAKKNRFGFFPAGGLAWVASKEPWLAKQEKWLSYLKFRLSYGKVGNDGIVSEPRFVFLPTIYKGGTGQKDNQNPEAFGSGNASRYIYYSYPNENIQWEIAEQSNLGIELKLFQGLIELQADLYKEIRHNIISLRTTIPASMGIEVNPLDNIGKTLSKGVDLSAKLQKAFSPDFWVILNGTLTYNKVRYKEIEEATDKPWYQLKLGHEISQPIGYIADGLFRDQAEIDNSPVQSGDVMPGDIKYRDINGDNIIDVNDATYIGFPETPRLIYGFSGFINYKAFEFNFAFQGSGQRSFFMNPSSLSPFVNDHAMLRSIYEDHWSEDNQARQAFWPRLSVYNITQHNPEEDWYNRNNAEVRKSTFFMRECKFLRCTSLELAYNLPSKSLRKVGLRNLKIYTRVNNPFIITNFHEWDVELGENGFNYPIQRTYSLGVNLSF